MNNKMTNGLVQLNAIKEDIRNNINIPTVMRPYTFFNDDGFGLKFSIKYINRHAEFRFILENDDNGNTRPDRLGIQVLQLIGFPEPKVVNTVISFDDCITSLNLWLIENEIKCVPMM